MASKNRKLSREDKSQSTGLLNQMDDDRDHSFVFISCMLMKVLKPNDIVAKQVQSINENFISALEVVDSVKEDIKSERETVTKEKTKKMVDDFFEGERVTTNEEQRRPRRNTTIPSHFNDFLETEIMQSEKNRRPNLQIFIECLDLLYDEFIRRFSTENIALWEAISALSPSSDVYLKYDILKPLFEYATTIPVLRDFYLKQKRSNKDLEAECRIYARGFKDKEWPKNEHEKIDLSEVAIIVIKNHQKRAPILSSLYQVAVTSGSGFTSRRVECVFSSLTQVDSLQRRSMRTQREADLTHLSFESKVLMNDVTFDDFYRE